MKGKILERIQVFVSPYVKAKLIFFAFEKKIPIYRLIEIALDNELSKERPFDMDFSLPTDETEEYAYAEQAGKILKAMETIGGAGLDQLVLLRHDIGIPDKLEFMYGFRECLEKGFIETYTPPANSWRKAEYPDNYKYYRLVQHNPKTTKKVRKKASRYEQFQKLKKEFKDV